VKHSGSLFVCAPTDSQKLGAIEKFEVKIFSAQVTWLEYFSALALINDITVMAQL